MADPMKRLPSCAAQPRTRTESRNFLLLPGRLFQPANNSETCYSNGVTSLQPQKNLRPRSSTLQDGEGRCREPPAPLRDPSKVLRPDCRPPGSRNILEFFPYCR